MIKAVILDCFGVLYQTPRWGERRQAKEVMGLRRNEELIDYTQSLRRAGTKVAVLSNCAHGVMEMLFSDRERRNWFDEFIVSAEVGLQKPQPEIFYLACQRLGLHPEECAFVDDIPRYVDTANEIGIYGLLYHDNQQIRSEVEKLLQS